MLKRLANSLLTFSFQAAVLFVVSSPVLAYSENDAQYVYGTGDQHILKYIVCLEHKMHTPNVSDNIETSLDAAQTACAHLQAKLSPLDVEDIRLNILEGGFAQGDAAEELDSDGNAPDENDNDKSEATHQETQVAEADSGSEEEAEKAARKCLTLPGETPLKGLPEAFDKVKLEINNTTHYGTTFIGVEKGVARVVMRVRENMYLSPLKTKTDYELSYKISNCKLTGEPQITWTGVDD